VALEEIVGKSAKLWAEYAHPTERLSIFTDAVGISRDRLPTQMELSGGEHFSSLIVTYCNYHRTDKVRVALHLSWCNEIAFLRGQRN
jgi:hypothetical protein